VTIEEGEKGPISVAVIVAAIERDERRETKGEPQNNRSFGDSDFINNFYKIFRNKDLFSIRLIG
jgi:hypothetical protein